MSSSGRGQMLIPWPNRIRDGSYEFGGRRHQLALDDVPERDAIHGLVRWAAWTVAAHEPNRAVMAHRLHPQPGYPFSLDLEIEYLLSDAGLRVRTTAVNTGSAPAPYGYGAHPYLSFGGKSIDTLVLQVPAHTVLSSDERGIPIGSGPAKGTELDFRAPRPIGSTRLDHAFTDLDRDGDGRARVTLWIPTRTRVLELWVDEEHSHLMLFSGDPLPDVNRRSLAVEPMTCPPNAFQSGEHVITLQPEQSFTSSWGIGRL